MGLKKNLLYNGILSLGQVLFPLLSIPYVSRVLEPAGIGRVSFIDSFAYYFVVIAEFGIITYGIREIARKKNDKPALNKLVSELLTLHFISSAISITLYLFFVVLLYQKIGDWRLVLFSFSFLIANTFACEWYFWGRERFGYIAIRSLLARFLGLVSLFLVVKQPADYFLYYGIIVGTSITIIVSNIVALCKDVHVSFRNANWKQHVPFTFLNYLISLLYSIPLMLDNVLLRLSSSVEAVAYYSLAVKIVRLAGSFMTDTLLVFYPRTVSLLNEGEQDKLQTTVLRSFQLIFLILTPVCGGLYLLAEPLTVTYFGNGLYQVSNNLKILSFYPLIKALGLFLNKQLLMPYDHEKSVLKGMVIGCIVFLLAIIPLSYFFADNGAAVAIMMSEVAVLLANRYYAGRLHTSLTSLDGRTILQALTGTVLFIPVVYLLQQVIGNELWLLIFSILVCLIVYSLFICLVWRNDAAMVAFGYIKKTLIRKEPKEDEYR